MKPISISWPSARPQPHPPHPLPCTSTTLLWWVWCREQLQPPPCQANPSNSTTFHSSRSNTLLWAIAPLRNSDTLLLLHNHSTLIMLPQLWQRNTPNSNKCPHSSTHSNLQHTRRPTNQPRNKYPHSNGRLMPQALWWSRPLPSQCPPTHPPVGPTPP